MTSTGTILRSTTELEALNPGAVLADHEGDHMVRVPRGWRYKDATVSTATWPSDDVLHLCGPVTLVQHSPMDAMLADPKGKQLVQDIHDRKAVHMQITRAHQLDALPEGTVIRDGDGDMAAKLEDGRWRYAKLHVTLDSDSVARTFAPLQVVVQP